MQWMTFSVTPSAARPHMFLHQQCIDFPCDAIDRAWWWEYNDRQKEVDAFVKFILCCQSRAIAILTHDALRPRTRRAWSDFSTDLSFLMKHPDSPEILVKPSPGGWTLANQNPSLLMSCNGCRYYVYKRLWSLYLVSFSQMQDRKKNKKQCELAYTKKENF